MVKEIKLPPELRYQRICGLLFKYPEIAEYEKDEIASFIRYGNIIDVGRLTSRDDLRSKFAIFQQAERKRLGLKVGDYFLVAVLLLIIVAITFFLWDAGYGR